MLPLRLRKTGDAAGLLNPVSHRRTTYALRGYRFTGMRSQFAKARR
jgi:hypothetical protein